MLLVNKLLFQNHPWVVDPRNSFIGKRTRKQPKNLDMQLKLTGELLMNSSNQDYWQQELERNLQAVEEYCSRYNLELVKI